jgi:hypothetical protein
MERDRWSTGATLFRQSANLQIFLSDLSAEPDWPWVDRMSGPDRRPLTKADDVFWQCGQVKSIGAHFCG